VHISGAFGVMTRHRDISRAVHSLVAQLGLTYAAVDLRYIKAGEFVFFEINPEGQYLWIEIETDILISAAIAKVLMGRLKTGATSN
jgi:hypothetical protein